MILGRTNLHGGISMTKRRADKAAAYRELQNHGVNVSKTNGIEFNAGSETWRHVLAKAAVGYVGRRYGYWVSSEVEVQQGDVDCLLWGLPARNTWAVECETSPTEATKKDKLNRYVLQQPGIDDMILLDVDAMPDSIGGVVDWVSGEMGLRP
jgi:hypothetical protein